MSGPAPQAPQGLSIKCVSPPPTLKWCTAQDVYYCKVVTELTKSQKYVKRAVVATPDKLFVCDPNGSVIRVIAYKAIAKVTTQEIEVSKKMGLVKEYETHLLLHIPTELDLVLDIPREPLEFVKVLKELLRCSGGVLEVGHLHKDAERLLSFANFAPPVGYIDTHTKIKHLNQSSKTQGGLSAAQAIKRNIKKLKPASFISEGKTIKLVLTDTVQLEWWEDNNLILPSVSRLMYTNGVLEASDTGVSCAVTEENGVALKETLRHIGLLAAYARTDTSGLPVPNKKRTDAKYIIAPRTATLIITDNEMLSLPEGSVAYIVSAHYGTSESYADVLDVVQSMVSNGGICLMVKNDVLGVDPVPGAVKCLTFMYEPLTTPQLAKPMVAHKEIEKEVESSSSKSRGSSYRHDPYKCESDGEIEVVGSTSSSFSSYAYSTTSSQQPRSPGSSSSVHAYQQYSSSSIPFATFIQNGMEALPDAYDISSPPLASSSESTSGIPPLMQTYDSEGSLSRRSSLSHQPHGQYTPSNSVNQPPPSPTVMLKHTSIGSSLPTSDAPPMLLSDSTGHYIDPNSDAKSNTTSEFTTIAAAAPTPPPQSQMTAQAQWVMQQQQMQHQHQHHHYHHHEHQHMHHHHHHQQQQQHQMQQQAYQQYPQQLQQLQQQQQPPPQQQQQLAAPIHKAAEQRTRGSSSKPATKGGFVEFTDTDGDFVRFSDMGGVIELSVNQNVMGHLKSLDYDRFEGKLNDGIGGCTLPMARRKGLEARLAWLAETAGVAHNIKADGPMVFDIQLGHVGESLGLSFEVLADGTVRISNVLAGSPCGRAGVVCGVIQTLDGQPVNTGDDLRRVVSEIREAGRKVFQLEVKHCPKEDATRTETTMITPASAPPSGPPQGGKGGKKGPKVPTKGNGRQNDALVRLFVLFKHGRRAEYASNERVPLGAHVLVESREGVDLGLVAGARLGGRKDDRYRVQRVAQSTEVETWKALISDEEKALQIAVQNAQMMQSPLTVHKCEIQYDRRKITFHYTGDPTKQQLVSFQQSCNFGCKVVLNNCQPPTGEKGDPIDLTSPAIPVL